MTKHILAISVGPVQGFIAEARRSRDLWFGSVLLSELSKAAAKCLHDLQTDSDSGLVFPAPSTAGELEALSPDSDRLEESLKVANKIVAVIDSDPTETIAKAKQSVQNRLNEFAEQALATISKRNLKIKKRVFDAQLKQYSQIEFFAAAVPLKSREHYDACRKEADRWLAGRKPVRIFMQPPNNDAVKSYDGESLPKSSLSGNLETVLEKGQASVRRRLHIGDAEQLDAISLIKRLGGKPDQFIPISRIALDPYIQGIQRGQFAGLTDQQNLRDIVAPFIEAGYVSKVPRSRDFPYDAQFLMSGRLDSFEDDANDEITVQQLAELKRVQQGLVREFGEPNPHVAFLVADGDRMGKAIGELTSIEEHRQLSQKLSDFAGSVRKIVEDQYNGCLLFSGGDDVVAYLPVDKAIPCANDLQIAFFDALKPLNLSATPTLSAGIGIGHCLESMQTLRQLARESEKAAKANNRNSLSVLWQTRSGSRYQWTRSWNADPAKLLKDACDAFENNLISSRSVYELLKLTRELEQQLMSENDGSLVNHIAIAEANRILKQSLRRSGMAERSESSCLLDQVTEAMQNRVDQGSQPLEVLKEFVGRMIIARRIREVAVQRNQALGVHA